MVKKYVATRNPIFKTLNKAIEYAKETYARSEDIIIFEGEPIFISKQKIVQELIPLKKKLTPKKQ